MKYDYPRFRSLEYVPVERPYRPRWMVFGYAAAITVTVAAFAWMCIDLASPGAHTGNRSGLADAGPFIALMILEFVWAFGYLVGAAIGWIWPGKNGR